MTPSFHIAYHMRYYLKPRKCPRCNYGFGVTKVLYNHINDVHQMTDRLLSYGRLFGLCEKQALFPIASGAEPILLKLVCLISPDTFSPLLRDPPAVSESPILIS
jgi:hypothetical protein